MKHTTHLINIMNGNEIKEIARMDFGEILCNEKTGEIVELWREGVDCSIIAVRMKTNTWAVKKILRKLCLID